MLSLTRRSKQKIRIGDDIVITIADVRGDTVKVHIEAPRSVRILREEVFVKVRAENAQAAQSAVTSEALAGLLPPAKAGVGE
jgi:carbon storage regulator